MTILMITYRSRTSIRDSRGREEVKNTLIESINPFIVSSSLAKKKLKKKSKPKKTGIFEAAP